MDTFSSIALLFSLIGFFCGMIAGFIAGASWISYHKR